MVEFLASRECATRPAGGIDDKNQSIARGCRYYHACSTSTCYIIVTSKIPVVSTRRDRLCAPRAIPQSSLPPVTPNRERATLVFCPSRTRPRRCSLAKVCRVCGPVPLTFTRVAPDLCRYFAAVLAGVRLLRTRTHLYRKSQGCSIPESLGGWVTHLCHLTDAGYEYPLLFLRSHLLTFVTDIS
jgi:hypothetical protein